MTVLQQFTS